MKKNIIQQRLLRKAPGSQEPCTMSSQAHRSSPWCCSKAFDKWQFVPLFKKLLKRNLPPDTHICVQGTGSLGQMGTTQIRDIQNLQWNSNRIGSNSSAICCLPWWLNRGWSSVEGTKSKCNGKNAENLWKLCIGSKPSLFDRTWSKEVQIEANVYENRLHNAAKPVNLQLYGQYIPQLLILDMNCKHGAWMQVQEVQV